MNPKAGWNSTSPEDPGDSIDCIKACVKKTSGIFYVGKGTVTVTLAIYE